MNNSNSFNVCSRCGSANSLSAKYCYQCGSQLKVPEEPVVETPVEEISEDEERKLIKDNGV